MTQPRSPNGVPVAADLVKVARAENQAEAELIQGLLREAGVPSALRRTRGFDVPDFLAAGPRDVLVPRSAVPLAREVLPRSEPGATAPAVSTAGSPLRVLAGVLIGLALLAIVVWLGTEVLL